MASRWNHTSFDYDPISAERADAAMRERLAALEAEQHAAEIELACPRCGGHTHLDYDGDRTDWHCHCADK